ncbi:HK97-gp10 family putative phage morphogenesis protein [Pediococcus pentosaceus]|uniref:HK97-gp10 family putative phage morphogenesis protein n=1 Tax=Pediococcus pentosaceus TaxID=1255 RepID=UPI0013300663|nr:HK97-gp10 family putative phage morphogenesis protein [Pediococcus pentosaceus]KAF0422771.1 hypothetical protein GBO84_05490 [Pediococcus pentosaceus]
MSNQRITLHGMKKLQKKLAKVAQKEEVKEIVKKRTAEMHSETQKLMLDLYKTKEEGGSSTGETRKSTVVVIEDDGLSGSVNIGTEYAPYLELGTRFMEARPALKPSYDKELPLFVSALKKLVR